MIWVLSVLGMFLTSTVALVGISWIEAQHQAKLNDRLHKRIDRLTPEQQAAVMAEHDEESDYS